MHSLRAYLQTLLSRLSYGSRLNPARDWGVLLSLTALVLVLIIGWNVWAFQTVVNGGVLGGAVASSPPVISQTSIDALRTLFSDRAAEEMNYAAGIYRFTDPSL